MEYRYLETTGVISAPAGTKRAGAGGPRRLPGKERERGGGSRRSGGVSRSHALSASSCPRASLANDLVFPVGEQGETVLVAAVNPGDIALDDKLTFLLSRPVRLVAASREEVEALIRKFYGEVSDTEAESVDSMLQGFTDETLRISDLHHPALARHGEPAPGATRPRAPFQRPGGAPQSFRLQQRPGIPIRPR